MNKPAAVLALSLLSPLARAADPGRTALWNTAKSNLEGNRVQVGSRRMLTAGKYQFHSMWTRDFAFASRGLLAMGDHRTVRDHLDTLLEHTSPEGLVPRALDTVPIGRRVVLGMIQHRLGLPSGKTKPGPLKAQVLDEHGSPSLDSNLLVIKTALDYAATTGDTKWLDGHKEKLAQLYRYYDRWKTRDGLLHQPAYSDWQDSVRREGKSFYLNLLYLDVTRRLGEASGTTPAQREAFEAQVKHKFYDAKKGMYRSLAGKSYVSLDGNLLALDLGYVKADSDEGRKLYAALKASPLWTRGGLPGTTTTRDYPSAWLHLPAKLSGLSHYHDEMHWSWLTALSAKVAHQMGDLDESKRIIDDVGTMAARDGGIGEIYRSKKGDALPRPFRSLLYRSEAPFSWGAGFVLDALKATRD